MEVALGLIQTGVEAAYNGVSCSTAGDYPSMGVSQWEGPRGDDLLSRIQGAEGFIGMTYSGICDSGNLEMLENLLGSEAGQEAQKNKLAEDCIDYIGTLQSIQTLDDSRCMIYAGMWCPTSLSVVHLFLQHREDRGYDLRSLEVMRDLFRDQYATAAGCEDYAEGYSNRAEATFNYVSELDLSAYGI